MDFSVIARAGLSVPDVAGIAGISRVMLWKYAQGIAQPSARPYKGVHHLPRLKLTLAILEKLIEKGSLPRKIENREQRLALVARLKALVDERVALQSANQ